MSLFDVAVEKVTQDVGHGNIIPVANRNMATYCEMFSLIERKPKPWYKSWSTKFDYVPAEVTINDILEESVDTKTAKIKSTVLYENYSSFPSYKRSAKIGGKLAKEFNIEASASKVLQVNLKLGNISKKEVLWDDLYGILNGKQIKDHPIIQLVRTNRKKKLFVVSAVITSGEENLSRQVETKEGVDGGASISPTISFNLDANASNDDKNHTSYKIPANTALAFSCNEISIRNNTLQLLLEERVRN